MEKKKSSQALKVSEMRLKFEDGAGLNSNFCVSANSKDKSDTNDVSELAGLAAVARRRDKTQIQTGVIVNSPFKKQLGRRSSASVEALTPTDLFKLKQELGGSNGATETSNQHVAARRTVSEFVLRKTSPNYDDDSDGALTPVPMPRRRNPKKSTSPNSVPAVIVRPQNKDVLQSVGNEQGGGSCLSQSWLHENSSVLTTKPLSDKIRRPLPDIPTSSPPTPLTVSDKTSPRINAKHTPCDFIPKVPCIGTGGSLVQQIVRGLNSGASPKQSLQAKNTSGGEMKASNISSLSPKVPSQDSNNDEVKSKCKSPNVQNAVKTLDAKAAANVNKPLPKGPPPHKPPRTFAHDVYLGQKTVNNRDGGKEVKKSVGFCDSPANHVYDEVCQSKAGSRIPTEGTDDWLAEAGSFQRQRSFTTPGEHNRGNNRRSFTKTPPPPPPPIFKRNNDTGTGTNEAKKLPAPATKITAPYAVSKLQHRFLAKFIQTKTATPEVPSRRSNFFVDLKKRFSPDTSIKRSLSNEHIYDEPYAEPELCDRHLLRSLSDEAISNPEYDGLSCGSRNAWPRHNPLAERNQKSVNNGSSRSPKEPGLHYMSTPILRKGRSISYDAGTAVTKPSDSKVQIRGWIKANAETPKMPASRPNIPVAVRSVVNESFLRSSHYRKSSDVTTASNDSQEDDSGDSDHELPASVLEKRIKYIRSVSRAASVKKDRPQYLLQHSFRHLFECVMVVGLRYTNRRDVYKPYLKLSYPEDAELSKCKVSTVLPFCFPDAEFWKPSFEGENFTFVLTDDKGGRSYGYCRRIKPAESPVSLPVVYCIVSHVLDFRFYYQILQELESRHGSTEAELMEYFECLFNRGMPRPGSALRISDYDEGKEIWRSLHPFMEHYGVDQLLKSLDINNLLKVFSATLLERRIIFSSSRLSKLSQCVHGLQCLLHPFSWQHTLIPILPSSLIEVTCTPTPYIIGIVNENIPDLDETEEALIVDLDRNRFIEETSDDLTTVIPKKFQKALVLALKIAKSIDDPAGSSQSLVSEAFLRMFVETVGHYSDFIATQEDGQKSFERDQFCSYLDSRSTNSFLQWFTETQLFEGFIHDRMINSESINKECLFERRIREYMGGSEHSGHSLKGNVREIKRKVRNFGGRLIGLRPQSKVP